MQNLANKYNRIRGSHCDGYEEFYLQNKTLCSLLKVN
jgi:hypothetical protein